MSGYDGDWLIFNEFDECVGHRRTSLGARRLIADAYGLTHFDLHYGEPDESGGYIVVVHEGGSVATYHVWPKRHPEVER